MIEVFGARIRQARALRRLSATSVAESMGWSNSRQSKLEQGSVAMFTEDEVETLGRILKFPAAFFSSEPRTRVAVDDLLFRAPKSMTKGEQEFLATFASLAGDFIHELDSQTRLPPVRVPALSGSAAAAPIALVAAQVRSVMGLRHDEPVDDLMYEVERIGAPIIVRRRGADDWQSEFSANSNGSRTERHLGYSTWVGGMRSRPLVVLRESESWERTRFTVAHELGHLVLHSAAAHSVHQDQEEEANRFATEFLAPASALARELPAVMSLLNLKPLKDKWGLSLGSLIRHLRSSDLISDARATTLTKQLHTRKNPSTGHSWGMTEPGWDDRAVERPRLISRWVESCYGATGPAALAARDSNVLPADVLDWFMATQRSAPGKEGQPAEVAAAPIAQHQFSGIDSEVVSLDLWRRRG